jgi:hypothetical protein
MKHVVFWGVAPCGFTVRPRFGGTCCLHLQGIITQAKKGVRRLVADCSSESTEGTVSNRRTLFLARVISSALKLETTRSFETSVYNKLTLHHITRDGFLQGML